MMDSEKNAPLTIGLADGMRELIKRDPAFGIELLRQAVDAYLQGDFEGGRGGLRNYIKATIGFEKLSEAVDIHPKSLIRMFSPQGNPTSESLFRVIGYLQQHAGVRLAVVASASAPSSMTGSHN